MQLQHLFEKEEWFAKSFYDWIIFFIAIIIISSINYNVLLIIFEIPIEYEILMFNSFVTFLIYPIFSKIF